MNTLPEEAERLIAHLRQEANDVKACFTTYSHAAVTFSVAAIAAIASLQRHWGAPIGFLGIAVAIVPLLVVRLGEHKYGAANRYHGYELHIERMLSLPSRARTPLDRRILAIGWEEAMRAWRIVQPTLYEAMHTHSVWWPHRLKRRYKRALFKWFDPRDSVTGRLAPKFEPTPESPRPNQTATYHAGTYLQTMCGVLYLLVLIAMIPVALALRHVSVSSPEYVAWGAFSGVCVAVFLMGRMIIRAETRRAMLESGFLSIHSCAVIWHAVTVAHLRALDRLEQRKDENSMLGYIWEMADLAISVAQRPLNIHAWIREATFNENGVRRWDEELLREEARTASTPMTQLHAVFDLGILLASRGLDHEALQTLLAVVSADPHFAREGARRMIEELFRKHGESSSLTRHYRRAFEAALFARRQSDPNHRIACPTCGKEDRRDRTTVLRGVRPVTLHRECFDGHAWHLPLVMNPATQPMPCDCDEAW